MRKSKKSSNLEEKISVHEPFEPEISKKVCPSSQIETKENEKDILSSSTQNTSIYFKEKQE